MISKQIRPHIEKAISELNEKDLKDIHIDTALKWCGRACAAMSLKLKQDAVEYAHEAIEHAALSGDDDLLKEIRAALKFSKIDL
jgi:hypothetical protein